MILQPVQLLQKFGQYRSGDTAQFLPHVAQRLIRVGVARAMPALEEPHTAIEPEVRRAAARRSRVKKDAAP